MVEIIWTEPALGDLDAIADYIALDKPDAASRFARRVFGHVELLAAHPDLGARIPEMRRDSRHRQIVEAPCRVFYRHDQERKKVFILGVMRGERLFKKSKLISRDKLKRGG